MFEELKKNLKQQQRIIRDINSIDSAIKNTPVQKKFFEESKIALIHQLNIINKAVPELLKETKTQKTILPSEKKQEKTESISYKTSREEEKSFVTINKQDRAEFLKKLKISENVLRQIKEEGKKSKEKIKLKPNQFAILANKLFRKYSEKLSPKMQDLSKDLKRGNVGILTSTYLSIALLSGSIAFLIGVLIYAFLLILNTSNWTYLWIPFLSTLITLTGFYLYPTGEASSAQKNINQELPFATIHMAAIAGSNIEPTKIFKIIANSKEYPNIGKEIKKVIAQTDLYGYDLVTALKNISKKTSSKKLAELFSGLATNISTGGELKNFLEKKAENYLLDYKLERQKYSELAGTFMDIYISILIAAPLVLMMLFIVMNVAGLGLGGLSITTLLAISIFAIIIVNIIFLVILNIKQPKV